MFGKRRRKDLTIKEFNEKLKLIKECYTIHYNTIPWNNMGYHAFINDKITKIELTFKDPDLGGKPVTYISDKAESSLSHQKQGMEAYSTLQKYYKTPHICDKEDALFSVSGILYYNKKYNKTRQKAYGYDMNSAFSWGMLQDMPKDTDKGPINFKKKINDYEWRVVKDDEIGFDDEGNLKLSGEIAYYIFKTEASPYKTFVERWYDKKKNANTPKEKTAAKDMLVMSVGFMQKHNFFMRAAIIGYCNRKIQSIIDKYPENVLVSNTDSIISNCRIPELEGNLGTNVGEWKFEHFGEFAYIGLNYQWDFQKPTYRGVAKAWFKENYDILTDGIPKNNNTYSYDAQKCQLVIRKEN